MTGEESTKPSRSESCPHISLWADQTCHTGTETEADPREIRRPPAQNPAKPGRTLRRHHRITRGLARSRPPAPRHDQFQQEKQTTAHQITRSRRRETEEKRGRPTRREDLPASATSSWKPGPGGARRTPDASAGASTEQWQSVAERSGADTREWRERQCCAVADAERKKTRGSLINGGLVGLVPPSDAPGRAIGRPG